MESLRQEALKLTESRLMALLTKTPDAKSEYLNCMSDGRGVSSGLGHNHRPRLRLEEAHLPFVKSFKEFDFSLVRRSAELQIAGLRTFRFANEASNVIFVGPTGVGKTHLSVALAREAVQAGIHVAFTTAFNLLSDLRLAYAENRLGQQLRSCLAPKVLFIDDVGYVPMDESGALLFFALVNARHEQGSIVLASNKSLHEWKSVFAQPVISTAILCRLLPNSELVNMRGNGQACRPRQPRRADRSGGKDDPFWWHGEPDVA